ncbi:hypothetical protein PRK78_005394 [Emydomyces testavorans]|uniref:Transcriptional regulator n=1 Tax=Emydomyces testavorans TaxID=2070801 RepID=A0AAF0DJP1_9EURO|nr:hypothetical protein PRK78_005394 [Emydomyces testavorans]
MSDSDSEALSSVDLPDVKSLEKALRDAVAQIFRSRNLEELTVKRVRLAAEKSLGLEAGFFKGDEVWKLKSDRIIKEEVEAQEQLKEEEDKKPSSAATKKPPVPGKKRKPSETAHTAKKKRKQSTPLEDDEELSSPLSDIEEPSVDEDKTISHSPVSTKVANKANKSAKNRRPTVDSASHSEIANIEQKEDAKPTKTGGDEDQGSESEMSVVLDEAPIPKRRKEKGPAKSRGKPKKPAPSKEANVDPDQAEIKRLQGWLIKCGIRKMWARELASFDTPKAKIRHLKDMLKDAGMEGRYSLEKAKAIKEERELKADLEVVQEGAKRWGKQEPDNEEAGEGRPRRRLARGFKSLNFLGDDGEESD